MAKKKLKNYPNVRVSPETFEILGYLKKERGSSYDTIIRDMLYEFAPFLLQTVENYHNPNVTWAGDKETIYHTNCAFGARGAYTNYWLRIKRKIEEEADASVTEGEIKQLEKLRSDVL